MCDRKDCLNCKLAVCVEDIIDKKKIKEERKKASAEHLREYRREYYREYRIKNREKILANQRKWYQLHKDEHISKVKERQRKATIEQMIHERQIG